MTSVSHQTKPIYELVTSRDFTHDSTLKRNLKRALSEYLEEANSCRCAPCHNNGVAVLRGNTLAAVRGQSLGRMLLMRFTVCLPLVYFVTKLEETV